LPRPKRSFSPEYRDEAVKMVLETSCPIARVAKELGINEGTLGNWVATYRREHAAFPALLVTDRKMAANSGLVSKISRCVGCLRDSASCMRADAARTCLVTAPALAPR
jgi:transposase-like protein